MRKTADWTKGISRLSHRGGRGGSLGKPQFTYGAEVPGPLERKSLFETHCSLKSAPRASTQTNCVCVCANAYLNIPHPKTLQTMSVQVGEREREGGREEEIWQGTEVLDRKRDEEEEEEVGKKEERKIPLLCSSCHGNPPDNTYSLCHSGMKESDELTPPLLSLFYSKRTLAMSKPHWPFPPLLFPVGALSLKKKYPVSFNWNQMNFA